MSAASHGLLVQFLWLPPYAVKFERRRNTEMSNILALLLLFLLSLRLVCTSFALPLISAIWISDMNLVALIITQHMAQSQTNEGNVPDVQRLK